MLITKYVEVEGTVYPVTLSDDSKALQAAYAAGGAIIGIWSPSGKIKDRQNESVTEDLSNCLYLTEDPSDADSVFLEKAVRRRFGLPFQIGTTERMTIREFRKDDPLETELVQEFDNRVFCDRERRDAYIDSQYRFCECGLWALEERTTGILVGKAGVTGGELGYHIYQPFRGQGLAEEACREIITYATEVMELQTLELNTASDNRRSIRLAERLGFKLQREESGWLCYEKRLQ